jgi:exodeoxyribonuclease VII small subunit
MSKKDKTISENIKDFEELVAWFDSSDFSLEESIENYKKIEILAKEIEGQLKSLKNEISIIKPKT